MKVSCMLIRLSLLLLLLSGCSSEAPYRLGPQQWGDLLVTVETRPVKPRQGMNEFIVIVNEASGKPGFDLMVNLRMNDQGRWRQAIPDGNIGVFRRALRVDDVAKDQLTVRLQDREGRSSVLHFALQAQMEDVSK